MGAINVVFDIDDTLCCNYGPTIEEIRFYEQKGMVMEAIKTHYVFPGVIELMKSLFQTDNVRVSFFSAGKKERNEIFVQKLLTHALGLDEYAKIEHEVVILSRDDVTDGKNLSKILKIGDQRHNALLIDDDMSYIVKGQEKNFIYASKLTHRNFDQISDDYDEQGNRNIPINLYELSVDNSDASSDDMVIIYDDSTENLDVPEEIYGADRDWIVKANDICAFRVEREFKLAFLNANNQYQEQVIKAKESPDLISALKSLLPEEKKTRSFTLDSGELAEKIRTKVQSYGGTTSRFVREMNKVCGLAGIIFKTIAAAQKANISVVEAMEQWDTTVKLIDQQHFYLYGAQKLVEVSPDFSIITPALYRRICTAPMDAQQRERLEEIEANESADCILM